VSGGDAEREDETMVKVAYKLDGVTVFEGGFAYRTADGMVGIRNGKRVDEVPAAYVRLVRDENGKLQTV
jgi:hypothetical protein